MVSVSTLRLVLIGLIAGGSIGVLFAIFEGTGTHPSSESRSHASYTLRPSRRQTIRSAGRVSTATTAALLQPRQDTRAIPTEPEAAHEASTAKTELEPVNAESVGESHGSGSAVAAGVDTHPAVATEQSVRVPSSGRVRAREPPVPAGLAHQQAVVAHAPAGTAWTDGRTDGWTDERPSYPRAFLCSNQCQHHVFSFHLISLEPWPQGDRSGEGLACNIEEHVSLDGLAVGWGIGNKKQTPEECCQACR